MSWLPAPSIPLLAFRAVYPGLSFCTSIGCIENLMPSQRGPQLCSPRNTEFPSPRGWLWGQSWGSGHVCYRGYGGVDFHQTPPLSNSASGPCELQLPPLDNRHKNRLVVFPIYVSYLCSKWSINVCYRSRHCHATDSYGPGSESCHHHWLASWWVTSHCELEISDLLKRNTALVDYREDVCV